VIAQKVRANEASCRLSGDQFVIVAPGIGVPSALALVDRIRRAWAKAAPHPNTFSVGAAAVTDQGGAEALLRADRAARRAKELGRDRTEVDAAVLTGASR
jgi:diguanylate cyclase (GGDEF)-like protein